jgi:peroxiredoxin
MAEHPVLKVGDPAPDFVLMNQDKKEIKLSDFRGKARVLLLFYPMDFSPVCTTEHCSFGPSLSESPSGTVVFGINADHPFSHAAYRQQYQIPYDLLSDPTRRTLKAYGMFAGEEPYNCAKRGTVVIGTDGRIEHYEEVPMKAPRDPAKIKKIAVSG